MRDHTDPVKLSADLHESRRYGAYTDRGYRDHGEVEIGSTHATVKTGPSARPVVAKILARTIDPESGAVIALVLDRLVVPHATSSIGPWQVSGAYVTQLQRPALGEAA